jgi:hypothetical protein
LIVSAGMAFFIFPQPHPFFPFLPQKQFFAQGRSFMQEQASAPFAMQGHSVCAFAIQGHLGASGITFVSVWANAGAAAKNTNDIRTIEIFFNT